MPAKFNHALLLLARQYRRESQGSVAKKAGLDQGYYSRIENGLLETPTLDNVAKIASSLDFPEAFFYLDDGLSGLPLSVHPMNRKRASVGAPALRQVHAELNLRLIHLRRFLRAADIHPELPLPEIDVYEGGGPQQIAQTIRRAWSIPEGPIENLTDLCERAGIMVVWCELENGIDGVTLKVRDLPPCIFLNRNVPPDRMRASLGHELGHVIMHHVPTDDMEDEANAFAAELLVPEKQFRRQFSGRGVVTLELLARQKAFWRMSMGFLLYRIGALEIRTRHQTEYLWKRMSSLGWRTREPQETDFRYEEPSVFPELLKIHGDVLGYDIGAMGELVSVNISDLQRMYGLYFSGARRGLYAVK
jgi:Zn-dependent peptidase ImmA (M78 family)/transcriptional regulator with XRE-family HTH domain